MTARNCRYKERSASIKELPSHLILEILTSGRLSAVDLVSLELTSSIFGGNHGLYPHKFRSLVDFVAFQLCDSNTIYARMAGNAQRELFDRCNGNWKRVLRFLQSVEQSSGMVETSAGKMQITTGRYHTLLINNSTVYSCGTSLCGVLGQGPEATQCVAFTRIDFPSLAQVMHVSATQYHAAFVMQSGQVFTCGDNSSFCCGHSTARPIFRPRLVEALEGVPCMQVSTGHNITVFLTRQGQVYTCGANTHGSNFCLGHGERHDELQPREIQTFQRMSIHVLRVAAGDEHAVALDSSGLVYTWGRGFWGALGHGYDVDKTTPKLVNSLKSRLVVQVCARRRETFVLADDGSVYGFGWMGLASLGFPDRGVSERIMRPKILRCLRAHRVSQISTGFCHTVVVTNRGQLFGFGDNEGAQLGHDTLRVFLEPTEILIQQMTDDKGNSDSR
ncbi:probable E3 ubiquitin-protein ligase HERC4 isoform X2 [Juglans microcarpa x Juglans regia]|uniref:probable E3 ubiquitin-protein ligase HERC4 isoform X2 n=1 Tax=Juglans microcarpa x Juglans regia TaxID=2249226 RepID=UPI001B7ECD73|nr:probable E3 ubiquitin-protein ligase HERC4 isoform X2 [Juglans microcarpa x Juglans regia]